MLESITWDSIAFNFFENLVSQLNCVQSIQSLIYVESGALVRLFFLTFRGGRLYNCFFLLDWEQICKSLVKLLVVSFWLSGRGKKLMALNISWRVIQIYKLEVQFIFHGEDFSLTVYVETIGVHQLSKLFPKLFLNRLVLRLIHFLFFADVLQKGPVYPVAAIVLAIHSFNLIISFGQSQSFWQLYNYFTIMSQLVGR